MYKLASGSCRAAEADHLPPVTILSPPRHVTFMLEGPGLLILLPLKSSVLVTLLSFFPDSSCSLGVALVAEH